MWPNQHGASRKHTQYFWGSRGNTGNGVQMYDIPDSAVWLELLAVGSGGSGRQGFNGTAGVAKGGGPGGGSGAISKLIIRTEFLPNNLYISCGGGPQTGNSGNPTAIHLTANNFGSAIDRLLFAGGGGLGAAANSAGGTAAGAAGAATSQATSGPWSSLGMYISMPGQAGTAGGTATAAGPSITFGNAGVFVGGGTGGGGCTTTTFAGGDILGTGLIQGIPGGLAATGAGQHGPRYDMPLTFLGGTGGGSSNSAVGGVGGDGNFGCGGGGGGAGVGASADGGWGGPGFAIITAYF